MNAKKIQLNDYKQLASAALLLGIGENVLAKITGSVLVDPNTSNEGKRKINIGLQLKTRNPVRHSYFFQLISFKREVKAFLELMNSIHSISVPMQHHNSTRLRDEFQ